MTKGYTLVEEANAWYSEQRRLAHIEEKYQAGTRLTRIREPRILEPAPDHLHCLVVVDTALELTRRPEDKQTMALTAFLAVCKVCGGVDHWSTESSLSEGSRPDGDLI